MRSPLGQRPVGVRGRENPIRCGQLLGRAARGGSRCRPVVHDAGRPVVRSARARPTREYSFRPVRVKPYLLPLVDAEPSGLLPHRVRDRDPADVVQQRGHLQVGSSTASGRPSRSAAPTASAATVREWPRKYGLLRSARSPKTSATGRTSGTVTCGCGSRSRTAACASVSDRSVSHSGRALREAGREARIEHSSGATSYGLRSASSIPPMLSKSTAIPASRAIARPDGHGLAGQPARPSLAPPRVVDVEQTGLDALGQPEPSGRVPPELARRRRELVSPTATLGDCGERQPEPFEGRPSPGEQGQEGPHGVSRTEALSVRPAATLAARSSPNSCAVSWAWPTQPTWCSRAV